MAKLCVVDYGVGNLFSLKNALDFLSVDAEISSDPKAIKAASELILPGVGAFGDAREQLSVGGLDELVVERAKAGVPLLGVCLGMQMLFERSFEYGHHVGLGLIPGDVVSMTERFATEGIALKVPHMGWNPLIFRQPDNPLLNRIEQGASVYFVHSFYASRCEANTAASAEYGIDVPALVSADNVFGCQFHPEKSGEVGLNILRSFLALV